VQLGFVAGVINRDKLSSFERVLWRATRGNLFMKNVELPGFVIDPQTTLEEEKNVVVIFFQGAQSEQKIRKICDSRGVHLYPCPDNANDRDALLKQVTERLREMRDVLAKSKAHRDQLLKNLAKQLRPWQAKVGREKAIADTLNLFNYDVGRKCLVGVGWCPVNAIGDIQLALRRATERSGALTPSILQIIDTEDEPPTYFQPNKVQAAFQVIVEAYGIPHYREINPTPMTVITFPFLFGVMFGDLGHGTVMALFSAGLIFYEKKLGRLRLDEIPMMIYSARYMLLLMGLFSMYIGLLYNEAFAVGLDFFGGTRWYNHDGDPSSRAVSIGDTEAQWCHKSGIYPFGVDPAWKGVSNEIGFYNMLKMKVSILFGVVHMTVGIVFSALNARFFKNVYDFWFVFVPSIIIFTSMFGYLAFLIVLKWITINSLSAPMPKIMNIMIDMFLAPFSCCYLQPDEKGYDPRSPSVKYADDRLYYGQPFIQGVLFILVIVSIPVMLCGKPFMLWREKKRHQVALPFDDDSLDDDFDKEKENGNIQHGVMKKNNDGDNHGHGGHDMSEIVMHQVIHSIEFVLGAVSNTASYLRLWALSLAHAELSIVFWERAFSLRLFNKAGRPAPSPGMMTNSTMSTTTTMNMTPAPTAEKHEEPMGVVGVAVNAFTGFSGWLAATIAVLMVMEALSAFLHALRLHWVEFQNKFYMGDGNKFLPFSFRAMAEDWENDGTEETA